MSIKLKLSQLSTKKIKNKKQKKRVNALNGWRHKVGKLQPKGEAGRVHPFP